MRAVGSAWPVQHTWWMYFSGLAATSFLSEPSRWHMSTAVRRSLYSCEYVLCASALPSVESCVCAHATQRQHLGTFAAAGSRLAAVGSAQQAQPPQHHPPPLPEVAAP